MSRDRCAGERRDQRPDLARDLEPQRVGPAGAPCTPGSGGSSGAVAVERDLDGLGAQVAQLGERALVDEPPASQDPDAVAERLDLAQDVRGQEHGLAAFLGLADAARNTPSISGSSPLVGSSRSSRSARVASAAISCTFCRLPFDNARTFLEVSSSKRSTSSSR